MENIFTPLKSLGSYHLVAWGSLLGTELYQKQIFPVYFNIQTGLVIATALKYPSGSVLGLANNIPDAAILGIAFALSTLNNLVFGPRTSRAMMERAHQETRDVKRLEVGTSQEMTQLKRMFSFNHAMSIHLNLIAIIATMVYGMKLGSTIAI